MKRILFPVLMFSALVFAGCKSGNEADMVCACFEDLVLNEDGIINNAALQVEDLTFSNIFNEEWQSWEGFAASSKTDIQTEGFENQYSVITGKAYSGTQFAVAYQGMEKPTITASKTVQFKEARITNGTYPYLTIKNGNDYSKKFAEGDYFNVTLKGFDATGAETGSVVVYLADFRDGKSEILNEWKLVDLTPLGSCIKVTLEFDSSDKGEYGLNTPAYAMFDDIKYVIAE